MSGFLRGAIRAGTIRIVAAQVIPAGWLECNGAAISRTAYGKLFGEIGTTYGVGDGSTTFNIPDARGEFLRGYDNGRGADSGRVFGSSQVGATQDHKHYGASYTGGSAFPGFGLGYVNGTSYAVAAAYMGGADTSTASVGNETRPRNLAMLMCIKY